MPRAKAWTGPSLLLVLLGFGVAFAQYDTGEDIWVGAERVARIYDKGTSASVADRRATIEAAIDDVIKTQNLENPEVTAMQVDDLFRIYVGGKQVMCVYPGDAEPQGKQPEELAKEWSDNLKAQLPKAAAVQVTEITVPTEPAPTETVTVTPPTEQPVTEEVVTEEPVTEAASNVGGGETETVVISLPVTQPAIRATEGAKLLVLESFNRTRNLNEDSYLVQRDALAAQLLNDLAQLFSSGADTVVTDLGEPEIAVAGSEEPGTRTGATVTPDTTVEVEVIPPSTTGAVTPTTTTGPADISDLIDEAELYKGIPEGDPNWAKVPQKRRINKKFELAAPPYYELKRTDPAAAKPIGDLLSTSRSQFTAGQFDASEQQLDQALRMLGVIR